MLTTYNKRYNDIRCILFLRNKNPKLWFNGQIIIGLVLTKPIFFEIPDE